MTVLMEVDSLASVSHILPLRIKSVVWAVRYGNAVIHVSCGASLVLSVYYGSSFLLYCLFVAGRSGFPVKHND